MQKKHELDLLKQLRAACYQVSVQFVHDPRQLVEGYRYMQEGYKDRFVSSEKKEGRERAA